MNTQHLDALQLGLSNARCRLAASKSANETALRKVWIAQIEREIVKEKEFLGICFEHARKKLSDDELMNELLKD